MSADDPSSLRTELASLAELVRENEPLARHSTFAIGGPADFYVEPKTLPELKKIVAWSNRHGLPLFPIGQGSNLLIGDKGVRGVVVRLRGEFEEISFDGERVSAGAGAPLPSLAKACAQNGLAGAEPLAGIPGTVGGALMTNAGTPEGDIGSLVDEVEILENSGKPAVLAKKDIVFSYRRSDLPGRLVLRARLKLRRGDKNDIMAAIQNQLNRRAKTQPLGSYNVGSIFKNPPGDFAARLVDAAGLKGLRVGGAAVSDKHANFIVNAGQATAEDVHRLIEKIRRTVQEKFGVLLETEIWFAGERSTF
ncbi:MAG TPA: UDP-N-acetylmuramate dehydrogenase [Elusimicrobiota bacterium]|nr:UDP-N-acetylmuramate dehydrogenase [Elusimicrobiota bacterium]